MDNGYNGYSTVLKFLNFFIRFIIVYSFYKLIVINSLIRYINNLKNSFFMRLYNFSTCRLLKSMSNMSNKLLCPGRLKDGSICPNHLEIICNLDQDSI